MNLRCEFQKPVEVLWYFSSLDSTASTSKIHVTCSCSEWWGLLITCRISHLRREGEHFCRSETDARAPTYTAGKR